MSHDTSMVSHRSHETEDRAASNGMSLGSRVTLLIAVLLLVIGGIIGSTLWVTSAENSDGLVINLAGRQRMLTQKLTKAALAYVIELREADETGKGGASTAHADGAAARSAATAKKPGLLVGQFTV